MSGTRDVVAGFRNRTSSALKSVLCTSSSCRLSWMFSRTNRTRTRSAGGGDRSRRIFVNVGRVFSARGRGFRRDGKDVNVYLCSLCRAVCFLRIGDGFGYRAELCEPRPISARGGDFFSGFRPDLSTGLDSFGESALLTTDGAECAECPIPPSHVD